MSTQWTSEEKTLLAECKNLTAAGTARVFKRRSERNENIKARSESAIRSYRNTHIRYAAQSKTTFRQRA